MIKLKKALGLVLAASLMLALLTGCGPKEADPIEAALGYPGDTVFFTLDGDEVTASDYFCWLIRNVDYITSAYVQMGYPGIDWNEDVGGITAKEFLKNEAMTNAKMGWIIEKMAGEMSIKLDAEDEKAYADQRAAAVEAEGSEEAYLNYLHSVLLTDETMKDTINLSALYAKIQEAYQNGEAAGDQTPPTKEETADFMESMGILKAKHILFLTMDPNLQGSTPYTPEKIAQQKAKAEEVLAQLQAASPEELPALFDSLMQEYSEDSGLSTNPEGYLFSTNPDGVKFSGRMVPEFEEGTAALDYNQISGLINSTYGYHIILRLDPTDDADTLAEYQGEWMASQLDTVVMERMEAAEVVTTEAFDNLDVEELYGQLTVYRESLNAPEDAKTPEEEEGQEGDIPEGTPADGGNAGTTDGATDGTPDGTSTDGAGTDGQEAPPQ